LRPKVLIAYRFFVILALLIPPLGISRAADYLTPKPDQAKNIGEWAGAPILSLLSESEGGLLLDLQVPAFSIDPLILDGINYDQLSLEGAAFTSQPGAPQLPVLSYLVGVPEDAVLSLEFASLETTSLPGSYRLPPAPRPAPLEEDFQPGGLEILEDPAAYASQELYPAQPARLAHVAWLRDQRIARLEVYPFQYLPVQGDLVLHRHLRIAVSFQPDSPLSFDCLSCDPEYQVNQPESTTDMDSSRFNIYPSIINPNPFEAVLRAGLLNYDSARQWRALPSQQNVPMQTRLDGPAYRIPIRRDGLYRLTHETLGEAGLDVANLDPTLFHLESQGQEVAYYLRDSDGDLHNFSPGEYLAFYGQKFYGDRLAELYQDEDNQWITFNAQDIDGTPIHWTPQFNAAMLEKYTSDNIYWLSLESTPGLQMDTIPGNPQAGTPVAQSYPAVVHAERSQYLQLTHFTGEDTWYWDELRFSTPSLTRSYTTTLTAPASGTYSATLRGEIIARAFNDNAGPDHHSVLSINDPTHTQPVDDRYWEGKSRYSFEANFPQSRLLEGTNTLEVVLYAMPAVGSELMYFDSFEIEYQRQFRADEDEIAFNPSQSGTWRYQVGGFTHPVYNVLDITYPLTPTWVTGAFWNGGTLDFQLNLGTGSKVYAGEFTDLPAGSLQLYTPADLSQPADYVIITHADFIASAQRLADYRASQGLSSLVVDITDLYNQFNFGIFHPIAIKNFVRYTFEQWDSPPSYVVLAGDGTWNMVGSTYYNQPPVYLPPNLSWVDLVQGEVDSANLLAAVVGDDPLADVSISRMPVNSPAELDAVIDKIIAYESAPREEWQRRLLFVSDNADEAGAFEMISNRIITDYVRTGFQAGRIYVRDYFEDPPDDQYCDPSKVCPPVNHAITTTLNTTGALLVNFVGHGAIDRWTHEFVFVNDDIDGLVNGNRLPVILSLTCLDGYWLHPGFASIGPLEGLMEDLLRAPGKGMLASFSPTGLGVATGHDSLQRGFYDALIHDGSWNLAQAAASAKLRLYATGSNFDLLHTYTIFGDPALRIASPYSLGVLPTNQADSGPPGAAIEYAFTLTNTGAITDTFHFEVADGDWSIALPENLTLPAGASGPITITVTIPEDTPDAASDTAVIWVASQGDTSQVRSLQVTTSLVHRLYLPAIVRE